MSIYKLTLKYEEYEPRGYKPIVKQDTIKAENDTIAFKKGYLRFSEEVFMSKYLHSSRNVSFNIVDKSGRNLLDKLSAHVVDSMEIKANKVNDDLLKDLKPVKIPKIDSIYN